MLRCVSDLFFPKKKKCTALQCIVTSTHLNWPALFYLFVRLNGKTGIGRSGTHIYMCLSKKLWTRTSQAALTEMALTEGNTQTYKMVSCWFRLQSQLFREQIFLLFSPLYVHSFIIFFINLMKLICDSTFFFASSRRPWTATSTSTSRMQSMWFNIIQIIPIMIQVQRKSIQPNLLLKYMEIYIVILYITTYQIFRFLLIFFVEFGAWKKTTTNSPLKHRKAILIESVTLIDF